MKRRFRKVNVAYGRNVSLLTNRVGSGGTTFSPITTPRFHPPPPCFSDISFHFLNLTHGSPSPTRTQFSLAIKSYNRIKKIKNKIPSIFFFSFFFFLISYSTIPTRVTNLCLFFFYKNMNIIN